MKTTTLLTSLIVLVLGVCQTSRADVTVNFLEVGPNVVGTLSGEFDLAATESFLGSENSGGFVFPSVGAVLFSGLLDTYATDVSFAGFGTGGFASWASSGTPFALFNGGGIGVPDGYISGDPLAATGTIAGSFASLGMTPGSYVTTLTNTTTGTSDTVTVNVGIPEPASAGIIGLVCFAAVLRRRR